MSRTASRTPPVYRFVVARCRTSLHVVKRKGLPLRSHVLKDGQHPLSMVLCSPLHLTYITLGPLKIVTVIIKMLLVPFVLLASLIAHTTCRIHARQQSAIPAASSAWQTVPSSQPKPDNTYSNGAAWRQGLPEDNSAPVPEIFNARDIDIPFRRLQQGNLMYFQEGELNQPDQITDVLSPNQFDFANQSACGIPDSAFFQSKVAIHPYWLKYAPDGLGLNRK